ncbi:MAG: TIGR02466 family protein [Sphingomonadaceae bacterium]
MADTDKYDALKIRAEHLGLFETVVLYARFAPADPLTADLEAAIRKRMTEHEGIRRSNVGGWHSDTDMLKWGGAPAEKLADMTIRIARRLSHFNEADPKKIDWRLSMWANVSPPGALNQTHAHPGNVWAAVYYVALGREDGDMESGGALRIEDPRFPLPQMRHTGFRAIGPDGKPQEPVQNYYPRRGDLILFPAWARHGVSPHEGEGESISIAMNLDARIKR